MKRLHGLAEDDPREEPLRGCCHGLPGTGKSRVIKWIIRMFKEALNWKHGVEFQCVAFQNTVAAAMEGLTLHSSGDIQIGGASDARRLEHTDIDVLYSRNQSLRWIIFDEIFMIPDELLGTFSQHLTDAAADSSRYKRRTDGSTRMFGGYNYLMLGDMNQLPPIPASAALFIPPIEKSRELRGKRWTSFGVTGRTRLIFMKNFLCRSASMIHSGMSSCKNVEQVH